MHSRALTRFLPSSRSRFSSSFASSASIHACCRIEEASLPRFSQKLYYPMHPGQRLINRYKVIAKLGYGAYSTVWLAHDEEQNSYAAVKVFIQDDSPASPVRNELENLQHLRCCPQEHAGAAVARLPHDIFQLASSVGFHHCVVSQPQGCNLWTLRHLFPDSRLPPEFVKVAVRYLLACINWLYLDAGMIHTDITSTNVLTQAANDELFDAIVQEEQRTPSTPTMVGDHPVYQSCGQPRNVLDLTGAAYLTDFGSACSASSNQTDWRMSDTYRAPEILMGVPWGCQVDVWSIGVLALELMEGRSLFDPMDYEHGQYVLPLALAQYISVLGPPAMWMVEESQNPNVPSFFDKQGKWIGEVPIPDFSLENWLSGLPAGEEKDKFIRLTRRILVWDSLERATSFDLLHDRWTNIA